MKGRIGWKSITFLLVSQLFIGCISKTDHDEYNQLISRSFSYQNLSDYQQSLIDNFIDEMFPEGSSLDQVMGDYASLRSTIRLASALLFRDSAGDQANAVEILNWILKHQHLDPNTKMYGVWKTAVLRDQLDQNWREFIGCDLIIIYQNYQEVLPDELLENIKHGLIHAALGAKKRDVTPQYTNISVMSAFLMNYVGTTFDIVELKEAGLQKANDINALFLQHNTFSEYNSPTYDGVSLVGFALWRELGQGQIKELGIKLEQLLWESIADHYNPILKNISGPYFRGYGMDMNKYLSITGLWIAIALDDQVLAPLPEGKSAKYFEVSNIAPIYHLGLSIPESVLLKLKKLPASRSISELIPNTIIAGDSIRKVTIQIDQYWMMGGLWGNRRPWNQIYTGTVHWMGSEGETEWLLIPGSRTTNVSVSNIEMAIYTTEIKPESSGDSELILYIYSKEITEENFSEEQWELGNMQFKIDTDLPFNYAEITDPSPKNTLSSISEYYPKVAEVSFKVPADWDSKVPILKIYPRYVSTQTK